jgi:hypothetical protein
MRVRFAASLTLPDDFQQLVRIGTDEECWPWLGEVSVFGYGIGPHGLSHVWTYKLHYGECLKPGYQVFHTCGSRLCCNPRHMRTRKRW